MRILSKDSDFYDYLQYVYIDKTVTFDRTNADVVGKKYVCLLLEHYWLGKHILLQVGITYWLFDVKTIKDNYDNVIDFIPTLIATWKCDSLPRVLGRLDIIKFDYPIFSAIVNDPTSDKSTKILVDAINTNNFKRTLSISDEDKVPILKTSGLSHLIDPLAIYLAFEEYFSLERTAGERTESVGLTNKERIENHGFDVKTSFRGKR